MINFNIDASGQKLYVNFDADVSSATAYTMTLEPEAGDKIAVVPTLEASDVVVGDETFIGNQFVSYSTVAGLFPRAGRWRAKATATLASSVLATNYTLFRVTP